MPLEQPLIDDEVQPGHHRASAAAALAVHGCPRSPGDRDRRCHRSARSSPYDAIPAPFGAAVSGHPGGRPCCRWAIRYVTPSIARNAVITAISMGAVCRAPTWVMNAARRTMLNGAVII